MNELLGAQDRAVDMGLGCEVDDRIAPHRRAPYGIRIGDVAPDEFVIDALEVRRVARVRELVEDDDVRAALRESTHEV